MYSWFRRLIFEISIQVDPLKVRGGDRNAHIALNVVANALAPYVGARNLHFLNIMDYAAGDPAEAKVRMALRSWCRQICSFDHVTVPNFDTIQAGFSALCLLKQPSSHIPPATVGYINVAPIYGPEQGGNGEHDFLMLLLDNGTVVFSPNAGCNISYLLPYTVAILKLDFEGEDCPHPQGHQGQFRSWWNFPQAIARVLRGDFTRVIGAWSRNPGMKNSFMGGPGEFEFKAPPMVIFGGADNFGNLRFILTNESEVVRTWKPGDKFLVYVDGEERAEAVYCPSNLDRADTISIRPGSNIIDSHGVPCAFLDGLIIEGSAMRKIEYPSPNGDILELRRVAEQASCIV